MSKNQLPADWQKRHITSFRDIRHIENSSLSDTFLGVPVTVNNLQHIGIFYGDVLIVKLTNELNENVLCVWETPLGRMIKFGYENFGEMVLHDKADFKQSWNVEQIKLLGVAVRLERDYLAEAK